MEGARATRRRRVGGKESIRPMPGRPNGPDGDPFGPSVARPYSGARRGVGWKDLRRHGSDGTVPAMGPVAGDAQSGE